MPNHAKGTELQIGSEFGESKSLRYGITMREDFRPDWASAPGETIADMLAERGMTVDELAQHIARPPTFVAELLDGRARISVDLARTLANVLGASLQFWIARDGHYHEDAANLSANNQDWLKTIPLTDMIKFGWIQRVKPPDDVTACLRYFGVSSIPGWHQKYARIEHLAAFRTSRSFESQPGAVAAWLRQGEILGERIDCRPWSPAAFEASLPEIRRLTRKRDPARFLPALENICAESGVAFVVVRSPNGCRASGATRMISADKMLLQLSFRYLSDDQFWFTFFHEAGHALLHGGAGLFVDGIGEKRSVEEREADEFAERALIPEEYRSEFGSLKAARQVMKFAAKLGIAPGIVVGQLQHREKIPRTWLNGLKSRYNWDQ